MCASASPSPIIPSAQRFCSPRAAIDEHPISVTFVDGLVYPFGHDHGDSTFMRRIRSCSALAMATAPHCSDRVHRHPLESNETTCVHSPCDSQPSTRYSHNLLVTFASDECASGVHMCITRVQWTPSPGETVTRSHCAEPASPRDDMDPCGVRAPCDALRTTRAALTNEGADAP